MATEDPEAGSDPFASEQALYAPIKAFLESQGYAVKGEVAACDVVAVRGDEPPVVVELKLRFSLELLLQAVDRLALAETIYLAFPDLPRSGWRKRRRRIEKLCRLLGFGILLVGRDRSGTARVVPALDPSPYRPRAHPRRQGRLLREFARRVGDPNDGGGNRRPLVTAYRQDALRLAAALADGPQNVATLRQATGNADAGPYLQRDVYGWFERIDRGVYGLSPRGRAALTDYADVLEELRNTGM